MYDMLLYECLSWWGPHDSVEKLSKGTHGEKYERVLDKVVLLVFPLEACISSSSIMLLHCSQTE